jgi:hypothetical protein
VTEDSEDGANGTYGAAAIALRAAEVAAASHALGRPLAEPVELPGGDWSMVLRCRDPAGGTVIVKAYPPTAEGASSFAAEAAGLEIASGSGLTPNLLAVDQHRQTIVMSDLGQGGSLADALLGDSAEAACSATLSWATACGRLSVAASTRRAGFDAARARYLAGRHDHRHAAGLPGRVAAAAGEAAKLGVSSPAGLDAELARVVAAIRDGQPAIFSPGDVCPDNNLLTSDGIRFLDFEVA